MKSGNPCSIPYFWWQNIMTSPNGNILCDTGLLCGEYTGHRWIQRQVMTQSFDVFFDLHLNQQLSKQRRRRWFETPSRSLWRHCNETICNSFRNWWSRAYGTPSHLQPSCWHYGDRHRVKFYKGSLQWHHMSLIVSQITGIYTACSTSCWGYLPKKISKLLALCHAANIKWNLYKERNVFPWYLQQLVILQNKHMSPPPPECAITPQISKYFPHYFRVAFSCMGFTSTDIISMFF